MSRLSSAKPKIVPKAFVDLPSIKLHIAVNTNTQNQITGFKAEYKGKTFEATVVKMDIEKAWKSIEVFIAKQHKAK